MASATVNYLSPVHVPVKACAQVYLCLKAGWENQTVDGTRFVLATVLNNARTLDRQGIPKNVPNPRCDDETLFEIEYDDALLLDDPQTLAPYIINCEDICEINPYVCSLGQFIPLLIQPE